MNYLTNRPAPHASADAGSNMNIRRFVAENSRAALRQVRDALGGDAIILANRSVDGGVEVLAAAPEAVDALTRRMTGTPPATGSSVASSIGASLAPASAAVPSIRNAPPTPTELGIAPGAAPTDDAKRALPAIGKKRFASLFSRRTQVAEPPAALLPTMAEPLTSAPTAQAVARAATSYLSFADELSVASTGASAIAPATATGSSDEDVVTRLAPEAVALSRPAMTPIARQPDVPMPQGEALPVAAPEARAPTISAAELSDVVAREVSREVSRELSRELGRDVLNDLTQDVSREVSREVSQAVSREVSQVVSDEVAREVTREVTRDVTREVASSVSRDVTEQVTRELRAMQASLNDQLSTLTWTEAMRRQPARTKLMQDLILAGFSPALARHIQARLPEDCAADRATDWAKSILKRNLPVATDAEELISEGGVFALVGPTGVGKTTTVAKLAARFALKHGVDQLALITTDGFRIGAQDQLRIYGKILGIAVHSIHDQASLTSAIAHLADKKLVLIDTAGLSQRDERVAEQIAMLRGAKARRLVVLNATSDADTLDHVISNFADRDFAACVITKTDEAVRLGPVLDAVIRHRLRIHHVSTGQKVPEDLERPDAGTLIELALARPAPRPAFDLQTGEEPVWMSAMASRAGALDPALLDPASHVTEGVRV